MNSYFRVHLHNVPSSIEDDLASFCIKNGASGLSESLDYAQPDLAYEPHVLDRRSHDIDVFFETKPTHQFIENLKLEFPMLQLSEHEEIQKDWLEEWKKGFLPFNLAGKYWIVPSWLPSPVSEEYTITIDPGMAFGTGTHATTKMASYFVNKVFSKAKNPQELSLIDVGTGTGILAMLAAKFHLKKVVGIEIDPEARRVARENIKLNHFDQIEIPDLILEEVHEQFDFIVANIVDGVLIKIKPDLLRILKPGGQIFLTGILAEREDYFITHFFDSSDLKIIRRVEEDEWIGYWVQYL